MVADIEDEPSEVEPLPNIDFNIRQGNSLIGQIDAVVETNEDGNSELGAWERKTRFEDVKQAIKNHKSAGTSAEAQKWRKEAEARIEEHREKFDKILRGNSKMQASMTSQSMNSRLVALPLAVRIRGRIRGGWLRRVHREPTVGHALREPRRLLHPV